MTWRRIMVVWVVAVFAAGCGQGTLKPEVLHVGQEACAYCRMTLADTHFASQVLAPGELAKFFDDFGCLNHFLTGATAVPAGAVIYVIDHRTKEWVRAEDAVFSRVPMLATPMSSHLAAHASVESRQADPEARGGSALALGDVVPAAWQTQRGQR